LACAEIHDAFRTFCLNSPQHGARVGRYVLMPDHLHLFVSVNEISLSKWVKSLKNALSKSFRVLGYEAPHWQKGFFDHLLRSGESYSQKWDYVRENPVRGGLVSATEDWPYAGEIHDLEYPK
jgi:REP element-mobilizing transposase RayT